MEPVTLQPTLRWVAEGPIGLPGYLALIDQTLLPGQLAEIECRHVEVVWEAIRSLRVRGAPAIGIAAAYGVCVDLQKHLAQDRRSFLARFDEVTAYLASSRPTAVNLFWALDRLKAVVAAQASASPPDLLAALWAEACAIEEEDRQACRAIGRHGAELLAADQGVLTHCNAGGLATADYGTALAVIFQAHEQGKRPRVFVDETRPLLQGARLTAWELMQRGIDATLICDSMAAQVMRERKVQAVVTGADRIAANGDTANKIGTYSVAVLAAAHGIPFYIAAPTSTFDLTLESGDAIPIEQRAPEEITDSFGHRTAPAGVRVYNPAFDVTPARLIRAIVCERGVIRPVDEQAIRAMVGESASDR